VRNLAHRSAEAARETAGLIEASISKSDQGVVVTGQVLAHLGGLSTSAATMGGRLREILAKVREVDAFGAQIALASAEQSKGIGQITASLANMDKVTQSNAAGAEQTAAAAEQLSSQSQELRAATLELVRLVEGGSGTHDSLPLPEGRSAGPAVSAVRVSTGRGGRRARPDLIPMEEGAARPIRALGSAPKKAAEADWENF
jgi:methyl-accepting chemotaxis protein